MATWDTSNIYYRGMDRPMTGGFRKASRGFFGPGVYLTNQINVAKSYGPVIYTLQVKVPLFQAYAGRNGELERKHGLDDRIIAKMTPSMREKMANMKAWYKRDTAAFWEALSRTIGPDLACDAIEAQGYTGIEGNGDGHEIVVFNPQNVRIAGL